MRTRRRLRTKEQLATAFAARHETVALLLGDAVQKIIRSRRAIVAANGSSQRGVGVNLR